MIKLIEHDPSPYRLWYNDWIKKNAKGNVLDVGKSAYWDYGFQTIDISGEPSIVGDICDCKLPPASFDTVLCNGMYEFVSDPQKMVKEVERLLKPGGMAIFGFVGASYTPYKDNWNFYRNNIIFVERVVDKYNFDDKYYFIIIKKHEGIHGNPTIPSNRGTSKTSIRNDRQRASAL